MKEGNFDFQKCMDHYCTNARKNVYILKKKNELEKVKNFIFDLGDEYHARMPVASG